MRRRAWAGRPLVLLLLMLATAPLTVLRPDGVPSVTSAGDPACPARRSPLGPLASEPGLSMAVIRDGAMTTCATGARRAWGREPATPATVFDAASLSKPVIAYAALRLVDEGRLDLDAPIAGPHGAYTLRALLTHTAGFNNALVRAPAPTTPAGPFRYSGAGYIRVGQLIEGATGRQLADYMNGVVLPELGMTASSFGPSPATDSRRAAPSIDAGLVVGAFGLVGGVIGLILLAALAIVFRLVPGVTPAGRRMAARACVAVAVACGLAAPILLLGVANAGVVVAVVGVFAAALGVAAAAAGRWGVGPAILLTASLATALVFPVLRPAAPLALRNQAFLAPAGLRTTAEDYARFLDHIAGPGIAPDSAVALMRVPAVRAGPDADWTPGLGRRRGGEPALWHWGVNFPGYQSLAMRWPDGTTAVVLVNGGAMSLTPSGLRYSGLERARQSVVDLRHGQSQGPLWRDIQ